MKKTFMQFMQEMQGYDVYRKGTEERVWRWELYLTNFSIFQISQKYELRDRPQPTAE